MSYHKWVPFFFFVVLAMRNNPLVLFQFPHYNIPTILAMPHADSIGTGVGPRFRRSNLSV